MAKLIYGGITSLDGYINDENGEFDWSAPDAEVHAFVNELERSVGTYLYGRRMYDVMEVWETMPTEGEPDEIRDYAEIWRAAEKVVFSSTLEDVTTSRTRIEREFNPAWVRELKATSDRDIGLGGSELSAQAVRAGLVDEYYLLVSPVVVGGGTPFLPQGVRLNLELIDERRFGNGVVFMRYRAVS